MIWHPFLLASRSWHPSGTLDQINALIFCNFAFSCDASFAQARKFPPIEWFAEIGHNPNQRCSGPSDLHGGQLDMTSAFFMLSC